MHLSISKRLALSYGLSLSVLLGLFVIFIYFGFHWGLHRSFQAQLLQDELRIRSLLTSSDRAPALPEQVSGPVFLSAEEQDTESFVRLIALDGSLLYASPNMAALPVRAASIPETIDPAFINTVWRERPLQTLYTPFRESGGRHIGWLEVSRFESGMHSDLHRLGWLLGIGVFIGSISAIGVGYMMSRRAFLPITQIIHAAREIQEEPSGKRLPARFDVRDEITDLAEILNNLLDRLDASIDRERQFRADAAHQMFTPLSAMKSEIEIVLRRPREAEDYRLALDRTLQQTNRLNRLVDGLLKLSRAESDPPTTVCAQRIDALFRARIDQFAALAAQKKIAVQTITSASLRPRIHEGDLCDVIDILLENAIKYTPPGGQVLLAAEDRAETIEFRIADTGSGMTEEEMRHAFDRFYRSDRPEIDAAGGTGLGLSIARATIQAYRGTMSIESAGVGAGTTFRVELPADRSA